MKVFVLLALAAVSGLSEAGDARKGQFPAVVKLETPDDWGGHFGHYDICTGVIISPTFVLTSAGCANIANVNWVMAGMYQIVEGNTVPLPSYLQQVTIEARILHPDYDTTRGNRGLPSLNDIALLKLSEKLNFTDLIQPLALPSEDYKIPVNSSVQVAGYGVYLQAGTTWVYGYSTLQTTNASAVDYQTCWDSVDNFLAGTDIVQLDDDLTQCIGPFADVNSLPSTYADQGGPIIQNNQVVGISSWTLVFFNNESAKGKTGPPGIYVKVASYVSWIKQYVDDL